ncbi:MAG: LytTR family DNA-binding domain-containing protein [Bacteroidota bacterium]
MTTKQRYNCLVVDDEELARTLLDNYLQRLPHLDLVGQCKNPLEAMTYLQDGKIDILFLDIQMPELTGIEFLKTIPNKPQVILTTAYPDYALEGYALAITDYLLKPIGFDRFVLGVNKAVDLIQLQEKASQSVKMPAATPVAKDYLLVKADHKLHKIKLSDILYIQSMREYVAIYTPQGRLLSLNSLKKLDLELPTEQFMRIHKSYLIAIDKVSTLEGNLVHIGKEKIPIGAHYKEAVLRRIF